MELADEFGGEHTDNMPRPVGGPVQRDPIPFNKWITGWPGGGHTGFKVNHPSECEFVENPAPKPLSLRSAKLHKNSS